MRVIHSHIPPLMSAPGSVLAVRITRKALAARERNIRRGCSKQRRCQWVKTLTMLMTKQTPSMPARAPITLRMELGVLLGRAMTGLLENEEDSEGNS